MLGSSAVFPKLALLSNEVVDVIKEATLQRS